MNLCLLRCLRSAKNLGILLENLYFSLLAKFIEKATVEHNIVLNQAEQRHIAKQLRDDMIGLGPIEPLLKDEKITEVMVNNYNNIYIESQGMVYRTNISFQDNDHVLKIALLRTNNHLKGMHHPFEALDRKKLRLHRHNQLLACRKSVNH